MKKIVYVPIEIKSREFLAKVVLALNLANNNYQVVVGKSTEVEKLCTLGPRGTTQLVSKASFIKPCSLPLI